MLGRGSGGLEKISATYSKILSSKNLLSFNIIRNGSATGSQFLGRTFKIKTFIFTKLYHTIKLIVFIKKNKVTIAISHGRRAFEFADLLRFLLNLFFRYKLEIALVLHSNNDVKFISKVDMVFCLTGLMQKKAEKISPNDKVFLVQNPCFSNDLYQKNKELKFKIDKNFIKIGLIARLHNETKSIDTAVKAIDTLVNEYKIKNIKLSIAGDGPDFDYLNNLIIDFKLENFVELLGWKDESFWKEIDILYVTSKIETFGLSPIEGILYKKIIICSDILTLKEVVPMNDRYSFKTGDFRDLAKKTSQLLINNLEEINDDFEIYFQYIEKYSEENIGNVIKSIIKSTENAF